MADATGKSMKAELKVDPCAEMDAKTSTWVQGIAAFRKKFKPIVYSRDVVLDARKWDPKKLSKALYALVRFELKVFAVQGSDWAKKVSRGGAKAEAEAIARYSRAYEKLRKDIADKCAAALEEIEADKGDNKRPLKDTRAALAALSGAKPKALFNAPTEAVVLTFKKLSRDLAAAGDDTRAAARAQKAAQAAIEKVLAAHDKTASDVHEGLAMLQKAAQTIRKTRDASPLLVQFGKALDKISGQMKALQLRIQRFGGALEDAIATVKDQRLSESDAVSQARGFAEFATYDKLATTVLGAVSKLNTAFAKIEKELK